MASGVYSQFLIDMPQGTIVWKASGGSTIKAQLTDSSYTFDNTNAETHDYRNDVEGNKISGTTDQTLTLVDPAEDTTNDRVELDSSSDLTFSSVASGTCAAVILYKDNGGASSADELIAYLDFSGGNITANGGDITVQFNAEGCVAFGY